MGDQAGQGENGILKRSRGGEKAGRTGAHSRRADRLVDRLGQTVGQEMGRRGYRLKGAKRPRERDKRAKRHVATERNVEMYTHKGRLRGIHR